ncbi:Sperm-tail PG-rich repeat-containing protein 2 [Nowakowskiella sp. JEL0407]|nr:Sperm-tail PG-rich repeat-containing protein 2 [Nowakowskiella sp. JEL0407]
MYSRAERQFFDSKLLHANPNLGPGCYTADEPALYAGKILGEDGYAPFSSLAPRISTFDQLIQPGPAPGNYDIPLEIISFQNIEKGAIFGKSQAERFEKISSITPGPGKYEIPSTLDLKPAIKEFNRKSRSEKHALLQVPVVQLGDKENTSHTTQVKKKYVQSENSTGRKSLIVDAMSSGKQYNAEKPTDSVSKHISWKRKHIPPSIPVGRSSFGYQEIEDGALVPRVPPRKNPELTAAYNFNSSFVEKAKHEKRGFKFGQSSHRLQYKEGLAPGPGAYDVHVDSHRDTGNSAALMTLSPCIRLTDEIVANEIKRSVPGPGAYDIKAPLQTKLAQKKGSIISPGGKDGRLTCYINSAQIKNPGPGTYYPEMSNIRREISFRTQPFGSTMPRFNNRDEYHSKNNPAPGSYDVEEIDSMATHIYRKSGQNGLSNAMRPFGSISLRFPRQKLNTLPGPGAYSTTPPNYQKTKAKSNSTFHALLSKGPFKINVNGVEIDPTKIHVPVFGTQTSRFNHSNGNDLPPPGAYEVSQAFETMKVKGKIKNTSLESETNREIFPVKEHIPGPGEYEPALPNKKPTNYSENSAFLSTETRFSKKPERELVPGPGSYLSTNYDQGLIKKTYNITFESVEK